MKIINILHFCELVNQPEGHPLVRLKQFRVLVLFSKPGHADELVCKDHIRKASEKSLRRNNTTVYTLKMTDECNSQHIRIDLCYD